MMHAAGMAQLPDRGVSEGDTLVFDYPGEDEKRKGMKTCRNTHQAQQTGAHQSGGGGHDSVYHSSTTCLCVPACLYLGKLSLLLT